MEKRKLRNKKALQRVITVIMVVAMTITTLFTQKFDVNAEEIYNISYLGLDGATYTIEIASYDTTAGFSLINEPTKANAEFLGWTATLDGIDYSLNGTDMSATKAFTVPSGVTGDITLTANWKEADVPDATYYVLKPDFKLPGSSEDTYNLTPEAVLALKIVSQSTGHYTKAGTGSFYWNFAPNLSYAEEYNEADYTTSALYTKIEDTLATTPDLSTVTYQSEGYKYTLNSVNWYVIKQESADGWHVDGIGNWNREVVDYSLTYQIAAENVYKNANKTSFNVESGIVSLADISDTNFDTAKNFFTIKGVDVSQYTFDGWYTDTTYTTKISSFDAATTYTNKTVYGRYLKVTDVVLTASSTSALYTGGTINHTPSFDGVPAGTTVSGLTSIASGINVGTYTTSTTGTPVFTDANGNDVSYLYNVTAINEGTLSINPATVTITVDSKTKAAGSTDPAFTGSVTSNSLYVPTYVGYTRAAADSTKETAGDDITLTASYTANANVNYVIVPGKLTITASEVIIIEPPVIIEEEPTPLTPIIPEEPVIETPVEEPVEEPVVEPETIEDEETPLAPSVPEETLDQIEDDEVALSADLREGDCWIHWLILLLTVIYGLYSVSRSIARNRKIKELEEEQKETVMND